MRGPGQLETETQHFCVESRQKKVGLCCVQNKNKSGALASHRVLQKLLEDGEDGESFS